MDATPDVLFFNTRFKKSNTSEDPKAACQQNYHDYIASVQDRLRMEHNKGQGDYYTLGIFLSSCFGICKDYLKGFVEYSSAMEQICCTTSVSTLDLPHTGYIQ